MFGKTPNRMTRRQMLSSLMSATAAIAAGPWPFPWKPSIFQSSVDSFILEHASTAWILIHSSQERMMAGWEGFCPRSRPLQDYSTWFFGEYRGIKVYSSKYQNRLEFLIGFSTSQT
jgi:hypothetical protein